MIFVTVGQHPAGFDRLVHAADAMAALITEPVVVQRGGGEYTPEFASHFDFTDEEQMQEWLSRARVVVSHAGAGSILDALQADKPLVVVPRTPSLGEVIDSHQLELAEALSQQGRAVVVMTLSAEALRQAVEQVALIEAPASQPDGSTPVTCKLQGVLWGWLAEQSTSPAPWLWRLLG